MATLMTDDRTDVEETPAGLRIEMRPRGAACASAFLVVWLVPWAIAEVTVVWVLVSLLGKGPLEPAVVIFMVVWLGGWTTGGLSAMWQLGYGLFGKEIVTVSLEGVTTRADLLGLGRTKSYAAAEIGSLRVVEGRGGLTAALVFEVGKRNVRIGATLKPEAAAELAERIWTRFSGLRPLA